jgi:hypothetical protein
MAYNLGGLVGIDVTAAAATTPAFRPGTQVTLSDGTSWVYLAIPTSTAIRQYDCCAVVASNSTVNAITSTIGLKGYAIAIAQLAVSSDASNIQYMWFLNANPLGTTGYKVRVAASAAIDAKLATTAMGGTLDDTTAGTVLRIDGIVLTDSQPAGSSGSRTFRTNFNPLTWGGV